MLLHSLMIIYNPAQSSSIKYLTHMLSFLYWRGWYLKAHDKQCSFALSLSLSSVFFPFFLNNYMRVSAS